MKIIFNIALICFSFKEMFLDSLHIKNIYLWVFSCELPVSVDFSIGCWLFKK